MISKYPSAFSFIVLAGGLFCAGPAQPVSAATVFHEAFAGDNTTNLNGTAPDTRPGSEIWTAATTGAVIRKDGSIASTLATSAWLPITIQSGYIYTMTATVDITWQAASLTPIGIGFTADSPLNTLALGTGDYGLQVYRGGGWVLNDNGASVAAAPNNTLFSSGTPTDYEIKLVLDTSQTQWTLAGYLGGGQVDLNGSSAGLLYTFTTNPNITGVGINYASTTFHFDSFTVDKVAAVPEPAAAALLMGLGVLGLIACHRRRWQIR